MIYITGDTHGNFSRFKTEAFPAQKQMTKKDYIIICGDFGVWHDTPEQNYWFDWLENKPFTTLFVTGNHENYDYLKTLPITEFCGGNAQFIRPSIIHLMRGRIFTIEGKRFFTMGGASCHDISGGILSLDDPAFKRKRRELNARGERYRVDHLSWWKEELPDEKEYAEAWANIEKAGYETDYIITHCPPESIRMLLDMLGAKGYPADSLTLFLERIKQKVRYTGWYFGHYHRNLKVIDNHQLLYDDIVCLLPS